MFWILLTDHIYGTGCEKRAWDWICLGVSPSLEGEEHLVPAVISWNYGEKMINMSKGIFLSLPLSLCRYISYLLLFYIILFIYCVKLLASLATINNAKTFILHTKLWRFTGEGIVSPKSMQNIKNFSHAFANISLKHFYHI